MRLFVSCRFLDKAAIIEDNTPLDLQKQSPWRLVTLTKVEEAKLIINVIPIWLSTLVFGICATQTNTFFIKQATIMDRHITGNNSFTVPPASMFSLTALSLIISLTIYDKIFVPLLRRVTRNQRGINILQRIGTGMLFSLTTMIIAALVEKNRLDRSENNEPMSVIWLAPQFIVIGVADAFTLVGLQEYFYDQVPDSMRSLGIAIYLSVLGAANFLNNLLITAVDTLADDFSAKSWFGKDLNSSRLDRFYWFLAGVTAANICVFVVVAKRCPYKSVQPNQVVVDSSVSVA